MDQAEGLRTLMEPSERKAGVPAFPGVGEGEEPPGGNGPG